MSVAIEVFVAVNKFQSTLHYITCYRFVKKSLWLAIFKSESICQRYDITLKKKFSKSLRKKIYLSLQLLILSKYLSKYLLHGRLINLLS
jgi:hypothetical protein